MRLIVYGLVTITIQSTYRRSKRWLSLALIIEEGFAVAQLERIIEADFHVRVGGSGLPLVGAMDVVWCSTGAAGLWHVRDYKITLPSGAPDELYRSQLAFYALAVRELAERASEKSAGGGKTGLTKQNFEAVDVGLIFLREGGLIGSRRSFPRDFEWDGLRSRVLETAQGPCAARCRHSSW